MGKRLTFTFFYIIFKHVQINNKVISAQRRSSKFHTTLLEVVAFQKMLEATKKQLQTTYKSLFTK